MPAFEETAFHAGASRSVDRRDIEVDRVEWIELPDSQLPVDDLVWATLAAFAICAVMAIL